MTGLILGNAVSLWVAILLKSELKWLNNVIYGQYNVARNFGNVFQFMGGLIATSDGNELDKGRYVS